MTVLTLLTTCVCACVCKAADWRGVLLSCSLTAAINSLYHTPPFSSLLTFIPCFLTISSFLSRSCATEPKLFFLSKRCKTGNRSASFFCVNLLRVCAHARKAMFTEEQQVFVRLIWEDNELGSICNLLSPPLKYYWSNTELYSLQCRCLWVCGYKRAVHRN